MYVKINGTPQGILCVPLALAWLTKLKVNATKMGNKIIVKKDEIVTEFQKLKLPHFAEFWAQSNLDELHFDVADCEEIT